jgi:hypothetical protein
MITLTRVERRPRLNARSRRLAGLVLVTLWFSPLASAARAWLPGEAERCGCTNRVCCCAPASSAARPACHAADGGAAVRCHHASAEATAPALPALLPPAVTLLPAPRLQGAPSLPPAAARRGFDRVESPPPRQLRNA